MTLLREVMERPLDPGYAAAAQRRAAGGAPGRRAVVVTLVLALVCGAVTARAIAELRRPQPEAAQATAALQAEVKRRSARVDSDQRELDQLRSQVAELQARSLAGGREGDLAQQAALLELVSGVGPGDRSRPADHHGRRARVDSGARERSAGQRQPRPVAGARPRRADRGQRALVRGRRGDRDQRPAAHVALGDPLRRTGHPRGLPPARAPRTSSRPSATAAPSRPGSRRARRGPTCRRCATTTGSGRLSSRRRVWTCRARGARRPA